jgi:hypothetical protein
MGLVEFVICSVLHLSEFSTGHIALGPDNVHAFLDFTLTV